MKTKVLFCKGPVLWLFVNLARLINTDRHKRYNIFAKMIWCKQETIIIN